MQLTTHPNPDLSVGPDRHPRWNSAPHRRQGFHNLHRIARYSQTFRAGHVLDLRLSADLSIPAREDVRRLTALPWFSALAVTATAVGQHSHTRRSIGASEICLPPRS